MSPAPHPCERLPENRSRWPEPARWSGPTERVMRSSSSSIRERSGGVCRYFGGQSARESVPAGVAVERDPQSARGQLPARSRRGVGRRGVRRLSRVRLAHDDDGRSEFFGGRGSADDATDRRGRLDGAGLAHSGMFPCFLAGRLARLLRSARSALAIDTRVCAGSMMPSSSPRSAARKGDATL